MLRIVVEGGDLGDPEKILPQELKRAMTEAVLLLERAVKPKVPIGVTGAARGSVAGEVRGGPGGGSMGVPLSVGELLGVVGSPLPYVAVINDGRRPGQKAPPAEALELWVRRKIQWSRTRQGPRGGRKRLTAAEARGIAWVIAQRIGKRGIEGKRFYEEALRENEPRLEEIFDRAGYRIALKLTGN